MNRNNKQIFSKMKGATPKKPKPIPNSMPNGMIDGAMQNLFNQLIADGVQPDKNDELFKDLK